MGWASGSELALRLIDAIGANVDDPQVRLRIYREMIVAFAEHDCDTLDEARNNDSMFDSELDRYYKRRKMK